ncbi:MAG: hypothetical protein M1833_006852 [Piccolia ochrophora]|nr:MAG: hypothetical protein M1833_006852 [Piccolia ochrophora]
MSQPELKKRRRQDYGFQIEYRTRWSDNDMYDHLNNSVYYFLYDSVVNTYLMEHCSLQPPTSRQIGLVVYSASMYFATISFPAIVDLALSVTKLGKSSVTYEIGVFERGADDVKAVGRFVHVFVDRESGRPSSEGMEELLRKGLKRLYVDKEPTAKL